MLQICDILARIRGSVALTDPDSDPPASDPAILVGDLQGDDKKFFFSIFLSFTSGSIITPFIKDKKS